MANHALPTTASTYANFVLELNARIDDALKWNSTALTAPTNPPTNTIRWNATNLYLEKNTGTPAAPIWAALTSIINVGINGTVGATTANTGAFTTLSSSGIASLGANSTVGAVAITTSSNVQTLTNKTLTDPVFTASKLTSTITIPVGTDTLVGKTTADILTNKTLTDPKFSSGTALKDINGINLIVFPATVASAVNYLTISNSVTAQAPSILATGADANISINIVSKGTGVLYGNSIQLADISTVQTFTNKTLTSPVMSSISNGGTITIPAGTDTLVNLAAAQTLTNKTLTSPTISTINNGGVIAIPAGAGTLVTLAAVQTLTSKTLTSPVLTGPTLGTPVSGLMTNVTGLPLTSGVTGVLLPTNGGTGVSTLTGLAYGNGTGAFSVASAAQIVSAIGATAVANANTLTGFTNSAQASPIVGADSQTQNGIGYVNSMSLLGQVDGALYTQAYDSVYEHQIFGDYRTGQIAIRGKNANVWQAWRTVLDSSNFGSYAPTLTGGGASGSWGISVTNATNVTGTIASAVTAVTQTAGDNTTKVATTAYVATVSAGKAASGANGDITSLTALAAGGLPDNSVLTADIAALQVTGAKMAATTITADKLTGAQSGSAPAIVARAWCVFNGTTTGTNAPTAGSNVSTVTRNAAGDYTITFATAMPSSSYAVFSSANVSTSGPTLLSLSPFLVAATYTAPTTAAFKLGAQTPAGGGLLDPSYPISVVVFG